MCIPKPEVRETIFAPATICKISLKNDVRIMNREYFSQTITYKKRPGYFKNLFEPMTDSSWL